jgi:hypothetical protein
VNRIIKAFIFLILLFASKSMMAQGQVVPDGILFQAVARDANNNAAGNRNVYIQIYIKKGTVTGSTDYSESFKVVSTSEGIFSIIIGQGTRMSGPASLKLLDWAKSLYFVNIKIAIEPTLTNPDWKADNNYVDIGTSQLWTVPYAFAAEASKYADSSATITSILPGSKGGTGVANTGKTITVANNLITRGVGDLTITTTAASNVTFPTSGTLANTQFVADRIGQDTISLSNRIDSLKNRISVSSTLKLNISDTSAMLTSRIGRDTISLSNRINLKADKLNAKIDSSLYVNGKATITDTLFAKANVIVDSTILVKGLPVATLTGTEALANKTINGVRPTALATGFSIAGGTSTRTTLTVVGDVTVGGVNSGDQLITLTGDVSGSGTGTFTTTTNSVGGVSSSTIATLPTLIAANTASITANTSDILLRATIASPSLTGTPTAPTAIPGTSTNQLATTAFVSTLVTSAATPDADATTKGKLQLTGDLGGTAASPTVNNIGGKPVVLGGALTTSGNYSTTITTTGNTNVTMPTSGTIATLAGTESLTNKTVNGVNPESLNIGFSVTGGTVRSAKLTVLKDIVIGGGGANEGDRYVELTGDVNGGGFGTFSTTVSTIGGKPIVLGGALTTAGNYSTTITTTGNTNVTMPTSGTIATLAGTESLTNKTINGVRPTSLATGFSIAGGTTTNTTLTVVGDVTVGGVNSGDQLITLTGDVSGSGTGAFTTTTNSVGGVSSSTIATLPTLIAANTASITTNTSDILLRATIASPSLTGTPTAPTAAPGTNTSQLATTAFVSNLVTSAATPDADATTKGKLQLTGDLGGTAESPLVNKIGGKTVVLGGSLTTAGNYTTTITTTGNTNVTLPTSGTIATLSGTESLTNKTVNGVRPAAQNIGFTISGGTSTSTTLTVLKDVVLGGVNTGDQYVELTGDVTGGGFGTFTSTVTSVGGVSAATITTLPTLIASNTSSITANTADILLRATIASPSLTGTPTAPTAAPGTSTTQLATTAFVSNLVTGAATPDADATTKGKLQLTGDLGGSAGSPLVNKIGGKAITLGGTLTTAGNYTTTITTTDNTNITLPTSGTIATLAGTETLTNKTINGVRPTALATGFSIAGGTITNTTLTVVGDVTVGGVNSGDQLITLTGDVSGSGTGSFTTTTNSVGGVSSTTIATLPTLIASNTSSITANTADILLRATIASPSLTGTPTAPTAAPGTSTTQLATTAFVSNLVTGAATPDADATTKGKLQLTGDLGGSAGSPLVNKIGGKAITLGGTLITAGNYTTTITTTDNTNVTLPTSGTLATLSGTETLTNKTINGVRPTAQNVGFSISGGTATSTTLTVLKDVVLGGVNTGDQYFELTGDVTGGGFGTFTSTVTSVGGVSAATIATLPTLIASNTASITSNTSAIAANTASITSNTSAIAANTASITAEITRATNAETALDTRIISNTSSITANTADILLRATIASPSLTGTPTAPTAAPGTSTTQIATTAFVSGLVGGAATPDADATTKGKIQLTGDLGGSAESPLVNKIGGKAITLGGTLTTAGNYTTTITTTGITNVTLPVSGRLATIDEVGAAVGGAAPPDATSSVKGIIKLTNDLGGSADFPTVNSVGGVSSSTITTVASSVNSATSTNTPSTIVKRDVNGGFSTGTITGTLSGTASNANALTTGRIISTTGDVTYTSGAFNGTQDVTGAATVNSVGGVSSSTITTLPTLIASNTLSITSNTTAIAANMASITANTADILLRATIASPSFTGTPTAPTAAPGTSTNQIATTAFVSALVGGSGAVDATSSVKGILKLTNDLGGSADAPTVNSVGGVSSTTITTVSSNVLSATSTNTPSTIVKRDSNGGFSTGTITGTLSGTASNAIALTTGRTIGITGDITYTSPSFDGTSNITATGTLTNTGVTANTYGTSTSVPTITVDSKGRITSASATNIPSATSTVTGLLTSSDYAAFSAKQGALTAGEGITIGSGTISATDATSSAKGIVKLTNDLGGSADAPTVNSVGGVASSTITTLPTLIAANTSSITANTADILLRATIASPAFTGTPTAVTAAPGTSTNQIATTAFVSALVGGSGAVDATSSVKGILKLTNDLGGSADAPTVNSVGGVSSSTITTIASSVNSATSVNTPNTIVKRDGSGGFSTGTITGTLSGTASNAIALTTGRTIGITGDITYTSPAFDGTGNVTGVGTLTNTGVTANTYGTSTGIPTITVDGKGRITSASTTNIPSATSTVTGLLTSTDYAAFSAKQGALTAGAGITIGSGTISATDATSSAKGIIKLTNDLGGSADAPTVNSVGGVSSSTITTVSSNVLSATATNTANTIVKRDGSGNFAAGTITATAISSGTLTLTTPLAITSGGTGTNSATGTGSVVLSTSPALTGTPTAVTAAPGTNSTQIATTAFVAALVGGSGAPDATASVKGIIKLTNDLGGSADFPTVNSVGGVSSSTITTVSSNVLSATSSNTANTIVKRDGSGGFAAGTITATSINTGTLTSTSVGTNTLNVNSGLYTRTNSVLTNDGNGNAVWEVSGLYKLNGIVATNQTLSTTITSTSFSPTFTSTGGTGVHNLNIPMASATGTIAGLLSKTDYDAFNAKQGALTQGAGITIGSGTISATDATSSAKGIIKLTNDLGGSADAPTVNSVGGVSSSTITTVSSNVLSATATNTANTIVKRDGSGNFAAGTITATAISSGTLTLTTPLAISSGGTGTNSATGTGSVVLSTSPALTGTPTAVTAAPGTNSTQIATTAFVAAQVTGSITPDATALVKGKLQLTNDLGGSAELPTVNSVGGVSSSTITTVASAVNSATSTNTPNTIVKRDVNGGFSTGTITGTLSGTASNAIALTTGRTIGITGDITYTSPAFDGTGNVTGVGTLTNTGVTANTYGTSTGIPIITVDSKGRITSASTTNIPSATSSVTGLLTSSDYQVFSGKQDALTLGTGVASFLASPTSTNLATAVTNDVGTGSLVFSSAPTLTNATLSGTLTLTAPLTVANGGTGTSTYAKGDILYASAANTLSKLTVGNTGQVLTVNSGVPSWGSNGIFTLNTISAASQIFTTTTTGTDFTVTSTLGSGSMSNTAIHSFNLPDATETTRGLLSATNTQNIGGNKDFKGTVTMTSNLLANGNLVARNFKLNNSIDPTSSQYTVGSVMTASDASGLAQWSTNLNVGTITATAISSGTLSLTTPLSVSSGGTGTNSSTGTGSVVLSTSPALTGTPTAVTAAPGTSTTQIATTAFVAALVGGSGAVDATSSVKGIIKLTNDLGGSADAPTVNSLGGVSSSTITSVASNVLSATSTNTPNTIVKRDGSGDFAAGTITATAISSGTLSLTTPLAITSGGTGTNSATGTGSVVLSTSPALTGTPTAVTAAPGTSTTQIATTAFVAALVGGSGAVDATSSVKGIIKLTNDLGGSADAPTVTAIGGKSIVLGGPLTTVGNYTTTITTTDVTNITLPTSGTLATTDYVSSSVSGGATPDADAATKGKLQLTNDLGGSAALPTVNSVGGVSSSTITTVASNVLSATSVNTANTIVKRDGSGNFAAGGITVSSVVSSGNISSTSINTGTLTATSLVTNTLKVTGGTITASAVLTSDAFGNATWGSNGLYSLNGITSGTHSFTTGTTGSDFNISSTGSTHTFHIPNASSSARGLVSTGTQTFKGDKTFDNDIISNFTYFGRGNSQNSGTGVANNLSIGVGAKNFNAASNGTTGNYNIAIGATTLASLAGGTNNNAIGYYALRFNTGGSSNNAFGANALSNNTLGNYNTAIGEGALSLNAGTAVSGYGSDNTAVGFSSLAANTSGYQNTAIGSTSNVGSAGLSNATAIGFGAIVRNDNTIQLGNTSVTSVVTSGTLSATGATLTNLTVSNSLAVGTVTYPKVHGTNLQVLTTTGSGTLTWTTPSAGLSGVGTMTTTSYPNGATVSGNNIILAAADATNGGVLTNGAQTIPGQKSFKLAVTNLVAYDAGSSTTIDFSQSNLAFTTASPGAFTLSGMKNGGTYTLAVQGTVSGLSSFSASGFSIRSLGNYTTPGGKHTVYTFMVIGSTIYFSMVSEQ